LNIKEGGNGMKVIKRDGTTVDFDLQKIVVAISKANNAVEEPERIDADTIREIAESIYQKNKPRCV